MDALYRTSWLFVQQLMEPIEIVIGVERPNHYVISDEKGGTIFFAVEDEGKNQCSKFWCGARRPFHITIYDTVMNPVMHLTRPLSLYCCCFALPVLMDRVNVYDARNRELGVIKRKFSMCYPKLNIFLPGGVRKLHIRGQWGAVYRCLTDVDFMVMAPDEVNIVGQITRHYPGFFKEIFSNADIFGVWYPLNLNSQERALVLAATLLIDFEHFENTHHSVYW